ncbi:MAG: hypothetical protein IPJ82_02465 [Lewinellaceae bacterium]|nr:hypothetical protein [Lewinellaceae bacterium]
MEKNKHHDHLDDYVRKSFEEHEEEPSAGMWGRIEPELAPVRDPLAAATRRSWMRYRRHMAAAAIFLLFSGLVCTHLYYRQEIQNLTAERQKWQKTDRQTPLESVDNQAIKTRPDQYAEPAKPEKNAPSLFRKEKTPATGNATGPTRHDLFTTPDSGFPVPSVADARQGPRQEKTITPGTLRPESADLDPKDVAPLLSEPAIPVPPASEAGKTLPNFEVLDMGTLPLKISRPPEMTRFPAPVKPRRDPSGWYAGLHLTPAFALENAGQQSVRPGQRPMFVSRQDKPDVSLEWWLRAGKKLNRRWSLETGLGYREISRETTHSPRFRFGDGSVHSGGFARNFDYDLRTYGGSASVSLRMEQVDTSTPVADDEPVVLRIRTSEYMQIVRIPVLAVYRMGTGRLSGVVKAGFTGNLVLKNELNVSARMSQNNRLRLAQGANGFNYQFEDSGAFFPGYLAAGGVEFRLNRCISVVAETALSGDFPRKDVFGRRLPGLLCLGLNTGLNYYF